MVYVYTVAMDILPFRDLEAAIGQTSVLRYTNTQTLAFSQRFAVGSHVPKEAIPYIMHCPSIMEASHRPYLTGYEAIYI